MVCPMQTPVKFTAQRSLGKLRSVRHGLHRGTPTDKTWDTAFRGKSVHFSGFPLAVFREFSSLSNRLVGSLFS